jgi:hypothetical protein
MVLSILGTDLLRCGAGKMLLSFGRGEATMEYD